MCSLASVSITDPVTLAPLAVFDLEASGRARPGDALLEDQALSVLTWYDEAVAQLARLKAPVLAAPGASKSTGRMEVNIALAFAFFATFCGRLVKVVFYFVCFSS